MLLFDSFKDTIFLKESSDLQNKYDAIVTLLERYPNNELLQEELYMVKKGLDGEKEIHYQLKKANLGMFVLHDINLEFEDMTAQIDYVVFTKAYVYFIECKNLIGNVTINEKGDFIREYIFKNEKVKKGMYSPLRQVEAQRDVWIKIWNKNANIVNKIFASNNLTKTYKTLVVVCNQETILNTRFAPKDIKYKVIRADALIRLLQHDIDHQDKDLISSKSLLEKLANNFLKYNIDKNIDYVDFYTNKFDLNSNIAIKDLNLKNNCIDKESIKERLVILRKSVSKEMNIPAYYVFTNEELDQIIELMPKNLEKLKNANILPTIKLKTHGEKIINEINRNLS